MLAFFIKPLYYLYDEFVKFPPVEEEEWNAQLIGFIENYGFPCTAAWDGFHVLQAGMASMYCSLGWFPCTAAWDGFHVLQPGMVSMYCSLGWLPCVRTYVSQKIILQI